MKIAQGSYLGLTLSTLLLLNIHNLSAKSKDQCYALALSGGANKGAYQAGVIHGLAHLLPSEEVEWDVITGVSAGALNAGGISVWPVDKPVEMSEWLVGMWMNMTNEKVYVPWPGGFEEGIFNRSGVFDDTPLLNFVNDVLHSSGKIYRKITVSSVDSNTGQYITSDEDNVPFEELAERLVASASIPFVFPHRHIKNWTLMDGGTVWNSNLVSAMNRCQEIVGDDLSKIVMDVIILGQATLNESLTTTGESLGNYLRYWSISSYYNAMNDVLEFQDQYPNITYRYFFKSSKPLTSGLEEMEFTPEVLGPMIQIGKDDAKAVIGAGEGVGFQRFKEWHKNKEVREQHPDINTYLHMKL
ncbi:patatin-like phospholipase family protein [Stylonychia lemnae]|uniref:Patatin-like phospholipase family protein n=1 Tax=Stylonychia lemnae TaxID=5949 RepID=A0A078AM95_STYLE|nr:patatin-like phospholipase family protein [Stylonychia lemnae]|eukprot:CDW82507.1 patatin-like phospholipase family protein [Stylonychia lemnae]